MPIEVQERKLRGPESKTEVIKDVHDPTLIILDRIADFSGGVNYRDFNLVEDNQCVEMQNMIPSDIGQGRKGYLEFNSAAPYGVDRFNNILRFYQGTTNRNLVATGERSTTYGGKDSYTKLLIHFEGNDGDTAFTDHSATGHTITANGDAKISTDQYKFGFTSGYFDGTGDYLSLADHADWNLSDSLFTIDFWVRFTAFTNVRNAFCQCYKDANDYWKLYYDSTNNWFVLEYNVGGGGVTSKIWAWTPVVSTWYHVAFIRGWGGNANDWVPTVNGSALAAAQTFDITLAAMGQPLEIGMNEDANAYLHGHIDEFRFSNGIARQTANFTASTQPYESSTQTDKVYIAKDSDGSLTELVGGTDLTASQKYSLVTYKDDLFIASENQALQFCSNSKSKANCGGTLPTNAGHILCVHEDRLWNAGASAARDTIYYSAAGVYTSDPASDTDFTGGGTINVNQGDGDYITAMASFYRVLYVFKRTYVAQIFGSAAFNFEVFYPPIAVGAVGHKAVCRGGEFLYFVSWDGVYSLNPSGSLKKISDNIEPIFDQTAPTDWRVNRTYMDRINLFYWNDWLFMSYPSGSQDRPNRVMIYDHRRKGWFPQKGLDVNCACVQDGHSDQFELRTGGGSVGKIWKMNTGFTDNGSAIAFKLKTKYLDQKMPERDKVYNQVIADVETEDRVATVTVTFETNEGLIHQIQRETDAGILWGEHKWGTFYWGENAHINKNIPLSQEMRGTYIAGTFELTSSTTRLRVRSMTVVGKPEMLRR